MTTFLYSQIIVVRKVEFKIEFKNEFECKDMGIIKYCRGINVEKQLSERFV
jgi:hypothetical protein